MGIYKENQESGPVIGQSVSYTDRDVQSENPEKAPESRFDRPVQLVLPFDPPLQRESNVALDELYHNFEIVLKNKHAAQIEKKQILLTVLNNYKNGNPESSERAKTLLLKLNGI